jgi:hypothetical protein
VGRVHGGAAGHRVAPRPPGDRPSPSTSRRSPTGRSRTTWWPSPSTCPRR